LLRGRYDGVTGDAGLRRRIEDPTMRLESVRELKAALAKAVVGPLSAAAAPRSFGVAAQPLSEAAGHHRTVALGIARKGPRDFRLAVRLQRRELEFSPEVDRIRRMAKDEVDVRYIGRVIKRARAAATRRAAVPWNQKRHRPLRIGTSIGHFKITAGTLGCFVKGRADGRALILSNNHVLANENDAAAGDAILQPGPIDGGAKSRDAVGKLVRFVRLKRTGHNAVDCAVASVKDSIRFNHRDLRGVGRLTGVGPAFLDEGTRVAKVGRTTFATEGRVTAFELDNVIVGYDLGNLRFDNQVEIEGAGEEAFSAGGDSGSLIVDSDGRAVALLFAGGDVGGANGKGLTFANPIGAVLAALKVDLLY
jgi:hypothetical protein